MNQLNPYLLFDGEAREAMAFYHSVFGGDLEVMAFADMGMEGPDAQKVMHSSLTSPALTLMAGDLPEGQSLTPGLSVRLCLNGEGAEELRGWFAALAEGGEVQTPLEKQMWGDEFGQVADRFGMIWLVNITAV